MRISDWSSDVCSSDLGAAALFHRVLVHVFFGNKGIGTQAEINFIPELLADIGIVPLGIKTAGRIPIMGICSTVVIKTRTWVIQDPQNVISLSLDPGIFHIENLLGTGQQIGAEDLLLEEIGRAHV